MNNDTRLEKLGSWSKYSSIRTPKTCARPGTGTPGVYCFGCEKLSETSRETGLRPNRRTEQGNKKKTCRLIKTEWNGLAVLYTTESICHESDIQVNMSNTCFIAQIRLMMGQMPGNPVEAKLQGGELEANWGRVGAFLCKCLAFDGD